MKDDISEPTLDEDGNIIEVDAIERVKPVLEILEDDGTEEEEEEDDDSVEEDDEAEDESQEEEDK